MSVRIFHIRADLPLADFASAVFETLDIQDIEERDSDNYPGGIYYRGKIGDISLRICEESDIGWEDYQYWVVLDADLEPDEYQSLSDGLIGRLLSRGFGVASEAAHTEQSITREVFAEVDGAITSKREERTIPSG